MKKFLSITILLFGFFNMHAQDIEVTFSGTGESVIVDSVIASNLTTGESVIMPGTETLTLSGASGTSEVLSSSGIILYPNPFIGKTTLVLDQLKQERVVLSARNLIGQIIAIRTMELNSGTHYFDLSFGTQGLFLIDINGETQRSIKAICLYPTGSTEIQYIGETVSKSRSQKTYQNSYELSYTAGDWIHYQGYSNKFKTIVTDSSENNTNIEFEFVDCTDRVGRTYAVVRIGDQMWMAENLTYLNRVSASENGSYSSSFYYVYGYEGTNTSIARNRTYYIQYGVLYNWAAAMIACPTGWHLPSDDQWKNLEMFLGMDTTDANNAGTRVSGDVGNKLKSSIGWSSNGSGDNTSGLSLLPGGERACRFDIRDNPNYGYFGGIGETSYFWTSTELGNNGAYYRSFRYSNNAVRRDYYYRGAGFSVRCLKD